MKLPLIILAGPTAVGKSALSIQLAKALNGEIISADSMQVYKRMDIGSAKITSAEMNGVPHHLIDILEPWEEFNVVIFQTLAKQALADIWARHRLPILVGGTGFYIQALLYDIDFSAAAGTGEQRCELTRRLHEEGEQALFDELQAIDPDSAADLHPHNHKRVLRALEYFYQTGEQISVHNARERAKTSPYAFRYFVLNTERSKLYSKINERVEQMMAAGLLDEVRALAASGCTAELVAMQGLGYKELLASLTGELSLPAAVEQIKRGTRHFAKRQLTWFKREKAAIWLENNNQALKTMLESIRGEKDIWTYLNRQH